GSHTLAEIVGALGLRFSGPTANAVRVARTDGEAAISEGSRNDTLASMAGSMRGRGMTQEAIEAALLTTNMQQCNPPLSDDEVRGIACSISKYAPGAATDVVRTLNDAGNADRFAR